MKNPYETFLKSPSKEQWKKIGIERRAGVAVPLFSLYSKNSVGIGEIPDLELLIDWCVETGMSIIQLLPLNDAGFKYTPYDSQSSFALDPMYLSLSHLQNVPCEKYTKDIQDLKKKFPAGQGRVNYEIKRAKLTLLQQMHKDFGVASPGFLDYCEKNHFWLQDFAAYKVLKEIHHEASWEDWPEAFRHKEEKALAEVKEKYAKEIEFQMWLQWQLCLQMSAIKKKAAQKKVFLLGDLPFLVSKDSADVWSYQQYFKLELAAGAPPDLYFAKGQRWGMPPYNWEAIAKHDYDYLAGKLKYSEQFYDMYRIDHAVGIFRVWTIANSETEDSCGLHGHFDPKDERVWEAHGKRLLDVMLKNSKMLPCAEDLGTVPECSYTTLKEYGIPGMDVQRWKKDWGKTNAFLKPSDYRNNSISVISTHDMSSFKLWWKYEAETINEYLFTSFCEEKHIDVKRVKEELFEAEGSLNGRLKWKPQIKGTDKLLWSLQIKKENAWQVVSDYAASYGEKRAFMTWLGLDNEEKNLDQLSSAALQKIGESHSIFSIQLLQDWLSCDPQFKGDSNDFRFNVPGTVSEDNWSLVMPWSLEEMAKPSLAATIKSINQSTHRI